MTTAAAETVANARQREEWNGATGSRWLERHAAMDAQIAPFGRRAMDRAAVQPSARVLDVGCGCGETTFELARRVGETGEVVGVDISALLIDAARKQGQGRLLSNIRFEAADAQTHRFRPESFDLVFSRFGVMFFDDPDNAFRNLRSAVKRGGRLAFVCWPAPSENPPVGISLAVAARHLSLPSPTDPDAPSPSAFANPERVRGILARSGFADPGIERVTERLGGGTLDETGDVLMQIGPLGELLDSVDVETRIAIRADLRSALSEYEVEGRVWLDASAWLATAFA
jgi:SAM-dependent methyltransferase